MQRLRLGVIPQVNVRAAWRGNHILLALTATTMFISGAALQLKTSVNWIRSKSRGPCLIYVELTAYRILACDNAAVHTLLSSTKTMWLADFRVSYTVQLHQVRVRVWLAELRGRQHLPLDWWIWEGFSGSFNTWSRISLIRSLSSEKSWWLDQRGPRTGLDANSAQNNLSWLTQVVRHVSSDETFSLIRPWKWWEFLSRTI